MQQQISPFGKRSEGCARTRIAGIDEFAPIHLHRETKAVEEGLRVRHLAGADAPPAVVSAVVRADLGFLWLWPAAGVGPSS